ncbi:hypothetical protein B0H10DRAFT_2193483 [Mycena sp. CBHHK59/15]|nr:hypothetical protein B0H10DRAFT_2193483 [Mycena sp. CBHHK59/15]
MHYSAHPRARTTLEEPAAGAARVYEWWIVAGRVPCFLFFLRHVYPYNDASIARRVPVTTPKTLGEPFATPLATYARLRAPHRRPSRRRTPSREFVTRPASAAGASSGTPQNDAAHVQHIFTHAPLARDLGHLKRSILSRQDLVISGSAL